MFFVNGAVVGTWVAQIPWIQERFDLSKSAMGLVIVGMSLAVILALPIAGQAVVRHGSERMTWVGGIASALAVNLVVLAPHPLLVAAGLFVLGGSSATMDVSMNSHGVGVEQALGRPIMSSLHAGWSFGGMIGSGVRGAARRARHRRAHRGGGGLGAAARGAGRVRAPHRARLGGRGRGHAALHASPRAACCCWRSCACS